MKAEDAVTILENPAAARDSESAFNEARGLYERLRELDPNSRPYLDSVVGLIKACQAVIAVDAEHGEAHVLLAYAYYLLHQYIFSRTHARQALSLAAATIQHWSDQPIRQHLSAANVEKGCRVYDLIAGELSEIEPECAEREEVEMRFLESSQYARALVENPRDWTTLGISDE